MSQINIKKLDDNDFIQMQKDGTKDVIHQLNSLTFSMLRVNF